MRTIAAIVALAALCAPVVAGTAAEPERVTVQHCLIGFKRSVPNKTVDRTKADAGALAASILERARAGEDFDALVKEYTDDRYPGTYTLVNEGIARRSAAEFERGAMATSFGDVAFSLAIGEVGLAKYHAAHSPYGWHVIRRLE